MKIANPGAIKLGDMRIIKRGNRVYTQEYVPGGWEYTQLANDQTLTYCIAELIRRRFKYVGTETDDTVYYYSKRLPTTDELMPSSTRDEQIREALASIQRLERGGMSFEEIVHRMLRHG